MPSNTQGKHFVSTLSRYCPLHLPSADKYPQILIEVPAEGKCPHILTLATCKKEMRNTFRFLMKKKVFPL